MKLTKADFRCSFFDESCDIDQDVIDQCLQDQKLRELIEKYIQQDSILYNGMTDEDLKRELQKLLDESKNG